MASATYSVPLEAKTLFEEGILANPLLAHLPQELKSLGKHVKFSGSDKPSIPINWRFAESISALKALEATMLNHLLTRKYNIEPVEVEINTDHATLFIMSPMLGRYADGRPVSGFPPDPETQKLFPSQDKHRLDSMHRTLITNIYKTKDGRFYHTHGSMNPDSSLSALGLPADGPPQDDTYATVVSRIQAAVLHHSAPYLDTLMNDQHRQAGTIAYTSAEYFSTPHGRANSHVGLYEIIKDPSPASNHLPPAWWPDPPTPSTLSPSPCRPLAGLKILDLTRVIAAPTITRSLAELGASVMRVVSPDVTDLTAVLPDLNWGKWNCFLDLKSEEGKEKLRALIREADVVVDGYRPGVMERLGFGRGDVFELVRDRGEGSGRGRERRGVVHVGENCYGWYGEWRGRSGWQQISDAVCGVSAAYAQAMGVEGAVTPVFPNSDYCTGVCGSTAVLDALVRRAETGGSYGVDVALNYYSQWLVRSCGTYPQTVWAELWERHGSPVFQHYHAMQYLLPAMMKLLQQHDAEVLFQPAFFEQRVSKALNTTFIQVKPVAQFPNKEVELGYNVGTRGNGVDQPVWPDDLSVEVVTA